MLYEISKKRALSLVIIFIQSYCTLWAFMRTGGISARSVLSCGLFVIFFLFYHYTKTQVPDPALDTNRPPQLRRIKCSSCLLGGVFALLTMLGSRGQWVADLSSGVFRLTISGVCLIGFAFFYQQLLQLFLLRAGDFFFREAKTPVKKLPLLAFFACVLLWLPYFLYEFPGIMSPDSINQAEQILGMVPYSNHHPWAHTMLMGFFYTIGRMFTADVTAAISFFTVFQLCFMAFCAAYLVAALQKLRFGTSVCLAVIAFYAIVPYHAVFAVTLWKDVLFSGFALLFTLALVRLLLHTDDHSRFSLTLTCTIYAVSGICFGLFRSNGWYALLLTLPFLLFSFRNDLRRMVPLHLAILAVLLLVKGPVMNAYSVTQPDFVESLCIPLQQVSRVLVNDRILCEEETALIESVIDTTYIKKLYSPGFADNMKELVRAGHPEVLSSKKGAFFKLWLSLGLRYPGDYLAAYIDQTIGYWYPDTDYRAADIDGVVKNDTGIISKPLIGGKLVVKLKEIFLKLGDMLPLYGLLWSMGAMFWAFLTACAVLCIKSRAGLLIIYLPGLAVILTLLIATPVAAEFRYAYSLVYALPLYLLLPFMPRSGSQDETGRMEVDYENT